LRQQARASTTQPKNRTSHQQTEDRATPKSARRRSRSREDTSQSRPSSYCNDPRNSQARGSKELEKHGKQPQPPAKRAPDREASSGSGKRRSTDASTEYRNSQSKTTPPRRTDPHTSETQRSYASAGTRDTEILRLSLGTARNPHLGQTPTGTQSATTTGTIGTGKTEHEAYP